MVPRAINPVTELAKWRWNWRVVGIVAALVAACWRYWGLVMNADFAATSPRQGHEHAAEIFLALFAGFCIAAVAAGVSLILSRRKCSGKIKS
jgi:hypothetical protein